MPFDTFYMELNDLKLLLQNPEHLKNVIKKLRLDTTQSEEIKGFISLYDHFHGNTSEIEKYLSETEKLFKSTSTSGKKYFVLLKYAAVFLIIFGIGSLLYFIYTGSNSKEKLEIAGLYKDPGIPIYMSEETKINWAELMFAIEEKTTQEAEKVWLKIEKSAAKNDTTLYYGGIVYRNLKDSKKANYYFQLNLKTESVFHDQSHYFIAIYTWENGQLKKARKLLMELINAENLDIREAVRKHLKNDFSSN
jgi:hypothetical protein